MVDVPRLLDILRASGGDTTAVEVKAAAGGLPESLTPSLSALANLPGGGTIILGLDERNDFKPVGLTDPQTLKQGLAAKSRALAPPVRLTFEDAEIDGQQIVVAVVHECDPSAKPCRVAATGRAYLRAYDGDYELAALEEQAFLADRRPPHHDRAPVDGTATGDLDPELVATWRDNVRTNEPNGLGRFDDDEMLRRAGVVLADGRLSTAGLLALGRYPQEWFPRYVIQAAAEPEPGDPPGTRARNQTTITGPIPLMLDEAMAWARRSFGEAIVTAPDGTVTTASASYPFDAFRELISNALVHRDLDRWSEPLAIEVRLRRDRLVVSNPGGLYGITVDRLGHEGVTSARNARLVALCQHTRSPRTNARVIEELASGIPTVSASLDAAGLPPAHYVDTGIQFTVVLHRAPRPGPADTLNTTERRVYEALGDERLSVSELESALGLTAPNIRKALRALRAGGLAEQLGGRGRPTTYRRLP